MSPATGLSSDQPVIGVLAESRGLHAQFCSSCHFPADTKGRLAPCLHVFCLSCASSMATCLVCLASVTKLEPIPAGSKLFISPATLQGFRTPDDFSNHVNQVAAKLGEG